MDSTKSTVNQGAIRRTVKDSKVLMYVGIPMNNKGQIIGPDGSKLKKLMQETNCKIQLPSYVSNDGKDLYTKIYGNIHDVEQARMNIRNMMLYVVSFPISTTKLSEPKKYSLEQFAEKLEEEYTLEISCYTTRDNVTYLRVESGEKNEDKVKKAVYMLFYFFKKPEKTQVTSDMLLTYVEDNFIFDSRDIIQDYISRVNNVVITRTDGDLHLRNVRIRGNIKDVLRTRCFIRFACPVTLQFHPREFRVKDLKEVKRAVKIKWTVNGITIQACESNIGMLYCVYRYLTGGNTTATVKFNHDLPIIDTMIQNITMQKESIRQNEAESLLLQTDSPSLHTDETGKNTNAQKECIVNKYVDYLATRVIGPSVSVVFDAGRKRLPVFEKLCPQNQQQSVYTRKWQWTGTQWVFQIRK